MNVDHTVTSVRVADQATRRAVVRVLRATYLYEKRWVAKPGDQIPRSDLGCSDISWFLARIRGRPAGVLRVHFDPPLAEYARYGFKLLDSAANIEEFVTSNRVAEIGRFAVMPRYRGKFIIAAELMRAAAEETVARGYTHFVTDVFEDDPHSPLGFHTRVMGFHPVATHDIGELQSQSRRITLVLDLKACYRRLSVRRSWLFRYMTGQWADALHQRLAA
jgi:ribosomal protein S18 acetylase RimI-like enzyme